MNNLIISLGPWATNPGPVDVVPSTFTITKGGQSVSFAIMEPPTFSFSALTHTATLQAFVDLISSPTSITGLDFSPFLTGGILTVAFGASAATPDHPGSIAPTGTPAIWNLRAIIPEPGSLAVLGTGLLVLFGYFQLRNPNSPRG